jgi:hypothetical protein
VLPSAHDHRSPKEWQELGEEATKNEALEIEALNPATFSYTFKPLSSKGVGRLRGLTVKHLPIKIAATAMSFPGEYMPQCASIPRLHEGRVFQADAHEKGHLG